METIPVFVKIESPADVETLASYIREKVSDARNALQKIEDISHNESTLIEDWKSNFNKAQELISSLSELLPEPERV